MGRAAPKLKTPDTIAEIAGVLAEIAGSQGPMEFVLLEKARLVSLEGRKVHSTGRWVTINQKAASAAGRIVADIDIGVRSRTRDHGLGTRINVEPGQVMVLGQAGFQGDSPFAGVQSAKKTEEPMMLFYVIRAQTLTSDG